MFYNAYIHACSTKLFSKPSIKPTKKPLKRGQLFNFATLKPTLQNCCRYHNLKMEFLHINLVVYIDIYLGSKELSSSQYQRYILL